MRVRLALIKAYMKIKSQEIVPIGVYTLNISGPKILYCAVGALRDCGNSGVSWKAKNRLNETAYKMFGDVSIFYVNDFLGIDSVEKVYRKAIFSW